MTIVREAFLNDFRDLDTGEINDWFTITLQGEGMFGLEEPVEWVYPFEDIEIVASAGALNYIKVTITMKEGHTFLTVPSTRLSDGMWGDFLESNFVGNAESVSYIYNFSEYSDYKTVLPLPLRGDISSTPPVIVEGIPFNRLYYPSYEQLVELNNYRLEEIDYEGNIVETDLGQFITSLYRIPFIIEELGEPNTILLGNKRTLINAPTLDSRIINVSLGTITIPDLTEGGTIGYSNLNYVLYCPFISPIELNVADVSQTTIHIYFNMDVLSGESTINIVSGITERNIMSVRTQYGFNIPFNIGEQLSLNSNSILNNDVLVPYLEVTSLIPNNQTSIQTKIKTYLGSGLSYLQSDNPIVRINGTYDEQVKLENMIKSGVYFND